MNPLLFLQTLKSFDLDYSAKSGGTCLEALSKAEFTQLPNSNYCIFFKDARGIQFHNASVFLNTVKKAEKYLDITLFT